MAKTGVPSLDWALREDCLLIRFVRRGREMLSVVRRHFDALGLALHGNDGWTNCLDLWLIVFHRVSPPLWFLFDRSRTQLAS
jgi:hypothetical protein